MHQKVKLILLTLLLILPLAAVDAGMRSGGGGHGGGDDGGGGGGGGGGGTPGTLPVTDVNFRTNHFQGSGNCTGCHNNLYDNQGNDVSIGRQWLPSMMSNAARDPLWQAKVKHEMLENPQLRDIFDYKCNHCHGAVAGHEDDLINKQQRIFDYNGELGFNNPANTARYDQFMEGITCTICHQFQDDPIMGTEEMWSGNWIIDFDNTLPGKPLFGQYQNPQTSKMYMQTGYVATYSDHMNSSDVCGVCHEIRTPVVDINTGELVPGGKFVEQSTYNEWKYSSYKDNDTTCQDCHMPKTNGVRIASSGGMVSARNDFHQHTFVGSNTAMLDMLARNRPALGVDPYADFDSSIQNTREFLQNETVDMSIVSASRSGSTLNLTLKLDNKAGHKFPTGIQARRAWLHVKVKDRWGNMVFESGKMNSDGSIVGSSQDTNPGVVEPHYDVINNQNEVQIYEAVMADVNADPTFVIFFASSYAKDNRLLPNGHRDSAYNAIFGQAKYDSDFNAGSDKITYQVSLSGQGPYTVEADLQFQALAKPFMEAMFEYAEDETIGKFKALYDQPETIQNELLQSVSTTVN